MALFWQREQPWISGTQSSRAQNLDSLKECALKQTLHRESAAMISKPGFRWHMPSAQECVLKSAAQLSKTVSIQSLCVFDQLWGRSAPGCSGVPKQNSFGSLPGKGELSGCAKKSQGYP